MTGRTTLTMANLRGVDLRAPITADVDFAAIAEQLAKENRFNGATPGEVYSVAEHSVRCARAALDATGDRRLAAYLLLHDAHEAFLKDDTTPKKELIAQMAAENFGVLRDHIMQVFDLAPYRFDQVIHDAAGLAWPPPSNLIPAIKRWDLILFVTEWRDLMQNAVHPNWAPYSGIQPLAVGIVPSPDWRDARDIFIAACRDLLPKLGGSL